MRNELRNKDYRDSFVREFLKNGIAFQLQALRSKSELTQAQLGELAGKKQNVISRLENPNYGNFTINTLLDLASALDVALVVRFAPFSEVERLRGHLSREELAVASFSDEQETMTGASDSTVPTVVSQGVLAPSFFCMAETGRIAHQEAAIRTPYHTQSKTSSRHIEARVT